MIKNNEPHFFILLNILDKIFKKHDIDYWLECGSLIGAIREGTYIEWDNDMDVSIHFKDVKMVRQLKNEFARYDVLLGGFVSLGVTYKDASMCIFPQHTITKNKKQYLVQYRYPLHVWMKKFNSILEKSKIYWYLCSKIKLLETIRSPIDNLGNFAYIEFCDTVCPIPEYPEDYLKYMFGDWRTPHKFNKHQDVDNIYDKKIFKQGEKMIWKLVCPTCKCPLENDSTKTTFERSVAASTMKQTYSCPRCKKSVELWMT